MRVPSTAITKNYLRNLNRQTGKVQKYHEQLSSLKEVSKPSDDPMAVSKIMNLNSSIVQNKQFLNTIETSIDWTNVQDSALGHVGDSIQRVRVLVQSASNSTNDEGALTAIKNEIKNELGEIVDALNTNFDGRYVFAGRNGLERPFELIENEDGSIKIDYKGTENNLSREVSSGVYVDLFADGQQLLGEKIEGTDGAEDTNELSQFFNDIFKAIDKSDTKALSGDLLGRADEVLDNAVSTRAHTGAIAKRLEAVKDRNETEKINLYSLRSNEEDVDLAEKYMEFSMEMIAYQSSLQMGTKILQTSILNYL